MIEFATILLGYPNWWSTMLMAVFSFLESVKLAGKKLAPFCTHEGSGMGHSENDLARLCSEDEFLPGLSIIGHESEKSDSLLGAWIKRLGLEWELDGKRDFKTDIYKEQPDYGQRDCIWPVSASSVGCHGDIG